MRVAHTTRFYLLAVATLTGALCFAADVTTRDGTTYRNAKVTGVDPDGIRVTHSSGVTKLRFEDLPEAIQKQYHYDPTKAAAYRKEVEDAQKAAAARAAAAQPTNVSAAAVPQGTAADSPAESISVARTKHEPTTRNGKWTVRTNTSPVDDSQTVLLRLEAENPVTAGYKTDTPSLIIRYKERELELYVSFGFFLGSDSTKVTTRLGKDAATESTWSISTDYEAVFPPGDAKDLISSLVRYETFLIRLTPYGENPVTASFDIRGLSKALEAMRKEMSR